MFFLSRHLQAFFKISPRQADLLLREGHIWTWNTSLMIVESLLYILSKCCDCTGSNCGDFFVLKAGRVCADVLLLSTSLISFASV